VAGEKEEKPEPGRGGIRGGKGRSLKEERKSPLKGLREKGLGSGRGWAELKKSQLKGGRRIWGTGKEFQSAKEYKG